MTSLADGLPPEIAGHVHAEWRENEATYWATRDRLVGQYHGQWIGFAGGVVVATGTRPVVVLHAARQAAEHPFMICVGREGEPYRVRRAAFAYNTSYSGEPLPVLRAEFRSNPGVTGQVLDQVIVDTGADTSVLPWCGLSASPTRSGHGGTRGLERDRRGIGDDAGFPGVGFTERTRVSLPVTRRLRGTRAHPGAGRAELPRRVVPGSEWRGRNQPVTRKATTPQAVVHTNIRPSR